VIITDKQGIKTSDVMIDIDDVIVPWFDTVDDECRNQWDAHDAPVCTNWHMWEHYGRTQQEWSDVVISCVQKGLYHTIEPIPGAVEGMNLLRWYGHRIHVVTARGFMANGDNIREWTPAYLQNFGAAYDTLTFAKDKVEGMITALGGWTPPDARPSFDYAIDDGYHNFDHLSRAGVNVFLHDAPHNLHIDVDTAFRVKSLWEFAQMIISETVPAHLIPK